MQPVDAVIHMKICLIEDGAVCMRGSLSGQAAAEERSDLVLQIIHGERLLSMEFTKRMPSNHNHLEQGH